MITIHQHHRQTDRQTDRRTTCDRKTAVCTHRRVRAGPSFQLGTAAAEPYVRCAYEPATLFLRRAAYFDLTTFHTIVLALYCGQTRTDWHTRQTDTTLQPAILPELVARPRGAQLLPGYIVPTAYFRRLRQLDSCAAPHILISTAPHFPSATRYDADRHGQTRLASQPAILPVPS